MFDSVAPVAGEGSLGGGLSKTSRAGCGLKVGLCPVVLAGLMSVPCADSPSRSAQYNMGAAAEQLTIQVGNIRSMVHSIRRQHARPSKLRNNSSAQLMISGCGEGGLASNSRWLQSKCCSPWQLCQTSK